MSITLSSASRFPSCLLSARSEESICAWLRHLVCIFFWHTSGWHQSKLGHTWTHFYPKCIFWWLPELVLNRFCLSRMSLVIQMIQKISDFLWIKISIPHIDFFVCILICIIYKAFKCKYTCTLFSVLRTSKTSKPPLILYGVQYRITFSFSLFCTWTDKYTKTMSKYPQVDQKKAHV